MFKNGFFRKKSEGSNLYSTSASSLPDLSISANSSIKHRATKIFGRAWNAVAYSRWFSELPTPKNSDSLFWLLGRSYTTAQKEDFRFDFASKIWLSYREQFPPLNDKNVRSDLNWGCMIRSAQMMTAQALLVEKFGRDWMRYDVSPSDLVNIIRLFEDCETAPLGIHTLIAIARKLEFKNPVGRWYSPSEVFKLLRNAIDQSHSTLLNDIQLLMCIDNCVATKEIIDASDGWTKKVLLVVPLRLGTDKINEQYFDHIRNLFQLNTFLGIVGGRPRHACYFIGYLEHTLFHLDPHICQKYVKLDGTESDMHWETFHCRSINCLPLKEMDPSCALGFLLSNSEELEQLIEYLTKTGIADDNNASTNSLISIVSERPFYDSSLLSNSEYNNEDTGFELIMLRSTLQKCLNMPPMYSARLLSTTQPTAEETDKLFSKISVELRGHDKAVLLSYTTFLKNACEHLGIESSNIRHLPYVHWLQWALASKFVHKKTKVQYETRTYIKQMDVFNLTGSTASAFLEYIQRNIPEGVAMKVDYNEICQLPESVQKLIVEKSKSSS
ncbi:Cysteine protease [Aphelenchoides bicaudatus]|nr:Cysteine protease [Aphelenchoides bicaudatus]